MTLNEFKAWLEGFSDAMGDAPTPEQWKKIKEKLARVDAFTLPNTTGPLYRRPDIGYPNIGQPWITCGQHSVDEGTRVAAT